MTLARVAALIAVIAVVVAIPDPESLDQPTPPASPTPAPTAHSNYGVPEPAEDLGNVRPIKKAPPIPAGHRAPRALDSAPPFDSSVTATPEAVARSYALQATNWSASTLPRQIRRLQRLASGPLARELRRDTDYHRTLEAARHEDAAQIGRLVTIRLTDHAANRAQARVLMSEQTYGASLGNLPARRQERYTGRLKRTSRGWTVLAWQPEL